MDSVLDFLFLRRLKLEYISPPVCPFPIASATGFSIPVQTICPLPCPDAPAKSGNFLVWGIENLPGSCCTNVVCFNLYQQVGGSFVAVNECQPVNSLIVCSAGSWQVSAIFSTGVETAPLGPFVSDGTTPLTITLPFAEGVTSYRLTKNGSAVLLAFFSSGIEVCSPACYAVSQITSDGETCLSGLTCFPPAPPPPPVDSLHDVAAYWKLNDSANGVRLDSVGSNHLTDIGSNFGTGTGLVYSVCAAGTDVNPLGLEHADDAILGAGVGVSFSFAFWVFDSNNLSPGRPILSKAANLITNQEYLCDVQPDGNIGWRVRDTGGNSYQLNSGVSAGTAPTGPWIFVACGYDASIKQAWIQCNNGTLVTAITLADVVRTANSFDLFNFSDHSFRGIGSMSGLGLWKRRLTPTEITRLFNSGAGYALSNFYP